MIRTSALGLFVACAAPLSASAQDTIRVSVDSKGLEGDSASTTGRKPATSGGEKALVVFASRATNLVPADTNGFSDVFLRDLAAGTTTRIVFDFSGGETDGDSGSASITSDGNFVVFSSSATDLVKGDKNGTGDIFVLDRKNGAIERVSIDSGEVESDGNSFSPAISEDARFVVFTSIAANLVTNDGNGSNDIFLRDRQAGTTTCLSVDPGGAPGDSSSSSAWPLADGSKVAFSSNASDLVANDGNGRSDVFVRDVATGVTTRVSENEGGFELNDSSSNPSLSADGSLVAFTSSASNLHRDVPTKSTHAYVRDLVTGEVWLASRGVDGLPINASHFDPVLMTDASDSAGEPIVVFWSGATNLPDDGIADLDAFAVRPWSGASQCLSLDSSGVDSDNSSGGFVIASGVSPEGDAVFLSTSHVGLVTNDGNNSLDAFRRGLQWTLLGEFGTGLAGNGGYVPHLTGRSGSCEAGRWSIGIEDGLGQTFGHLWVGFGRTNGLPLFGGSFYLDFAQPLFPIPIVLDGVAGVGGTGGLALDGVNVENLGQFSLFLQCTLVDGRAPKGVSLSNALEIVIDA